MTGEEAATVLYEAALKRNNQLKLDIIATFETGPQSFFDVRIPKTATEEEMVRAIIGDISSDRRDKLGKLSVAQMYTKTVEQLQPYLLACWGKYYFDAGPRGDERSR